MLMKNFHIIWIWSSTFSKGQPKFSRYYYKIRRSFNNNWKKYKKWVNLFFYFTFSHKNRIVNVDSYVRFIYCPIELFIRHADMLFKATSQFHFINVKTFPNFGVIPYPPYALPISILIDNIAHIDIWLFYIDISCSAPKNTLCLKKKTK